MMMVEEGETASKIAGSTEGAGEETPSSKYDLETAKAEKSSKVDRDQLVRIVMIVNDDD